jgi:hypothetical protein
VLARSWLADHARVARVNVAMWLIVPSRKLALCKIEKVAGTVLSDLFCSLNKQHGSHDQPNRTLRDGGWADFEVDCDWFTASARDMAGYAVTGDAFVQRMEREGGWATVAFYRDPLARFLSAFLSKCTDGHDGSWDRQHICLPIFGSTSPTFAHAAQLVSQRGYAMPDGLAGDHWRLQADFCAGFHGFDLVFALSRDTLRDNVAAMLRAVGYADPTAECARSAWLAPGCKRAARTWRAAFRTFASSAQLRGAVDVSTCPAALRSPPQLSPAPARPSH